MDVKEISLSEWLYLKKHVPEEEWKIYKDFIEPIEKIYEIFMNQKHSGFTAHWFAPKIAQLVENRLLYKPFVPIHEGEEEWEEIDEGYYRSKRCLGLYKKDRKVYYHAAIVWKDENSTFLGHVNGISSAQLVRYPFYPKTFVVRIHYVEEAETEVIIDKDILKEALTYYIPSTEEARNFLKLML